MFSVVKNSVPLPHWTLPERRKNKQTPSERAPCAHQRAASRQQKQGRDKAPVIEKNGDVVLDVFDLFALVEIWLPRPIYRRVSVRVFHRRRTVSRRIFAMAMKKEM